MDVGHKCLQLQGHRHLVPVEMPREALPSLHLQLAGCSALPQVLSDRRQCQASTSGTLGPLKVALPVYGRQLMAAWKGEEFFFSFFTVKKSIESLFHHLNHLSTFKKWQCFLSMTEREFPGSVLMAGEELLIFPCACIITTLSIISCALSFMCILPLLIQWPCLRTSFP